MTLHCKQEIVTLQQRKGVYEMKRFLIIFLALSIMIFSSLAETNKPFNYKVYSKHKNYEIDKFDNKWVVIPSSDIKQGNKYVTLMLKIQGNENGLFEPPIFGIIIFEGRGEASEKATGLKIIVNDEIFTMNKIMDNGIILLDNITGKTLLTKMSKAKGISYRIITNKTHYDKEVKGKDYEGIKQLAKLIVENDAWAYVLENNNIIKSYGSLDALYKRFPIEYTSSTLAAEELTPEPTTTPVPLPTSTPTPRPDAPKNPVPQSYMNIKTGDIIKMGYYEKDNNTDNLREPIEWQVIDVNKKNNQALLLSSYGLEGLSYGKPMDTEEYTKQGLNWEGSYIRGWLNNDFYETAFSNEERERIIESKVKTNDKSGTIRTEDRIFILSKAEATQYLKKAKAMACTLTEYSRGILNIEQGAETDDGYCLWWLRDMTKVAKTDKKGNLIKNSGNEAGYIDGGNGVKTINKGKGCEVFCNYLCVVRPAMWIQLDEVPKPTPTPKPTKKPKQVSIIEDKSIKSLISSCPSDFLKAKDTTKAFYKDSYDTVFPKQDGIYTWRVSIQEGTIYFCDEANTVLFSFFTKGTPSDLIPHAEWEIKLLEALPGIEKRAKQYGMNFIAEKRVNGGDYAQWADSNGRIDLTDADKYKGVLEQAHSNLGMLELLDAFKDLGDIVNK